ncbi:MAG: FHA domain-containing serine/threonine-protein kinase [Planctomycetota bacterium]|mgnify:CR=1 FL=1
MAKLYVTSGDGIRKILDVGELVTLGRQSSNGVHILSPGVSRVHAEIRLVGGRWVLRDMESRNGTILNGETIRESVLKDGDEIRIGDALMRFEAAESTRGLDRPAAEALEPVDLNERFQIIDKIGGGSSTTTYKAVVRDQERLVALKILKPDLAPSGEDIARFLEAARALIGIRHPGLAEVLDAGRAGPVVYVAMEHVTGEPAAALLARERRIPPVRALGMVADAARGLGALHANGRLHLDVRPANLLVSADGRTKLVDAGLGFLSPEGGRAYAAPELAAGSPPSPAADFYSLGVTLHQLVLGIPPGASFDPERLEGILAPGLAALLGRCLERDPEARPDSAEALASEIDRQIEVEKILEAERARRRGERASPPPLPADGGEVPRGPSSAVRTAPVPLRRAAEFAASAKSGPWWLIPIALLVGLYVTDPDLLLDFVRPAEKRRDTRTDKINILITRAIDAEKSTAWNKAVEAWGNALENAKALGMLQLADRIQFRLDRISDLRGKTGPPPKKN